MKIETHKRAKEIELLVRNLLEMKEEYKIMPSKFLLKKIELTEGKLKQIDNQ